MDPTWDSTTQIAPEKNPEQPNASGVPTWDNTTDLEEKYGSNLGIAKSFGLGAARSATFGLSDEFLTRTGILKPEELKAYKEQNPAATTTGEIGGVLGAIAAPEGGLLGALAAPVKGVAELGGAATEAASAALPEATSTVGKILSQAGAHAAGSAVEGAAYGLGQSVSEDALGDPDALGEKLLSNIGMGAVLGGGIGAALGVGEIPIPKAIEKAGIDTQAVMGKVENALSKTASWVSGKSEEDIKELLKGLGTKEGAEMRKQATEGFKEREKTVRELSDGLSEQSDTMSSAVKKFFGGARQEEVSNLMSQVPKDQAFNSAVDLSGKLRDVTKSMRAEPEIYSATGRVKKLELVSEGLERRLTDASSSEEIYHAINDAKGQIQDLTKWGGAPVPAEADTVNAIKSIGRDFRLHLEDPAVYGEAGARQGALNAAYSDFAGASKDFISTFGRKLKSGETVIDKGKVNTFLNQMGRPGADLKQQILSDYLEASQGLAKQMGETSKNAVSNVDTDKLMDLFKKTQGITEGAESELESVNRFKRIQRIGDEGGLGVAAKAGAAAHFINPVLGGAYALYHTLRNPAELVHVLSTAERAAQKVTNGINRGASSIFRATEGTGSALRAYGAVQFASADERKKIHDKMEPQLSQLSNDPEQLINKLHENTAGLSQFAPKTAQGLQNTMTKATQFLQSKLPGNGIPQKPLSPKYQPSDTELAKWHKYFSIVEDPTQALKQVASGTLGKETMETLNAVYPKMLAEMQSAVMDKMTDHMGKDKPLPYSKKMALSLFLGQDLVHSLDSTSILANQNVLATATQAKASQQNAQMGRVNQKGLGKINKADQTLTAAQASAQRKEA